MVADRANLSRRELNSQVLSGIFPIEAYWASFDHVPGTWNVKFNQNLHIIIFVFSRENKKKPILFFFSSWRVV